MARYDRRILVPYLRDACCIEMVHLRAETQLDEARQTIRLCREKLYFVPHPPMMPQKEEYRLDRLKLLLKIGLAIGVSFFYIVLYMKFSSFLYVVGALLPLLIIGAIIRKNIKDANEEFDDAIKTYLDQRDRYEKEVSEREKWERWLQNAQKWEQLLIKEIPEIKSIRKCLYAVNIIPSQYRNLHAVYYLYDFFNSSQSDDLDSVIQTMLLEKIIARLDRIIEQNEEILLNQRRQLALQEACNEESRERHAAQMRSIAQLKENQYQQTEYLAMIEGNTRANAYFAAATWLQGLDR